MVTTQKDWEQQYYNTLTLRDMINSTQHFKKLSRNCQYVSQCGSILLFDLMLLNGCFRSKKTLQSSPTNCFPCRLRHPYCLSVGSNYNLFVSLFSHGCLSIRPPTPSANWCSVKTATPCALWV